MYSASLYIHMPWCVKKCPYCDFNSHELKSQLNEEQYINALIKDFTNEVAIFGARPISSIFIGGGTPSLFSGESFNYLLTEIKKLTSFACDIEITIEANPGTIDAKYFAAYLKAGINRISLGVQTFHDTLLKKIGRIH